MIDSPPDSILDGQEVRIASTDASGLTASQETSDVDIPRIEACTDGWTFRDMRMQCTRRWRLRHGLVVLGLALAPVAAIQGQAAPTEEPPKPALYSLPWLLRPAIPGTVLRLDKTVGFYEDPATGNSGITYVTSFHAAYKLAANWGIVFRESWVFE